MKTWSGINVFKGLMRMDPDQWKDLNSVGLLGVRYVDVTVTTGQLLALNATPKTLVAAPGAGKLLMFHRALLFLDYNSAAYDGIAAGEDLSFKYTNGSGAQVASVEATGFLDATADALRIAQPDVAAPTPVANAALVLHMLTGEIATGNSPLIVRTFYSVLPSTLS